MATERVKLTPNKFTTKNASNGITFDSDYFYLKSQAGGIFNVGGYSRSSMICGTDTGIIDVLEAGGFPVFTMGGYGVSFYTPSQISFAVPRFNKLTVAYSDQPFYGPTLGRDTTPYTPIYLNGTVIGYTRFSESALFEGDPSDIRGYNLSVTSIDNDYTNIITGSTVYPAGTITIPIPQIQPGYGLFTDQNQVAFFCTETPSQLSLAVTP